MSEQDEIEYGFKPFKMQAFFEMIPHGLLDRKFSGLSATERDILFFLFTFQSVCYMKLDDICDRLDMTKPTFIKWRDIMTGNGWIEQRRKRGKYGKDVIFMWINSAKVEQVHRDYIEWFNAEKASKTNLPADEKQVKPFNRAGKIILPEQVKSFNHSNTNKRNTNKEIQNDRPSADSVSQSAYEKFLSVVEEKPLHHKFGRYEFANVMVGRESYLERVWPIAQWFMNHCKTPNISTFAYNLAEVVELVEVWPAHDKLINFVEEYGTTRGGRQPWPSEVINEVRLMVAPKQPKIKPEWDGVI